MLVTRALYDLKSADASFRSFLALTLDEMNFIPSQADPSVWLRPTTKPDGEHYYEYILVYVDDILAIPYDLTNLMKHMNHNFKFKGDKYETP